MLPGMANDPGPVDAWHQRRYSFRDDVVVTDLGDQLVLLDPRTQEMFALDDAGRFIWQALPTSSLGQVADALAAHYGIGLATAAADVLDLVAELGDAGLLRAVSPAEPSV